MSSLFAQATVPSGFTAFIESAFYLVGLTTAVVVLWRQLRPREVSATKIAEQPVVVKGAQQFTPIEAHTELAARVTTLDERVDAQAVAIPQQIVAAVAEVDRKRSVSIANLHAKLDTEVRQLNDRIDAVPARTISLLRETQQLHEKR